MVKNNILFLVAASLTEARTLLPIMEAFQEEENCQISCVIARHRDVLLEKTKQFLLQKGVTFNITGIDASLNAEKLLDHFRPNAIVMANDSLIINRFVIRACNRRDIPTILIQEAPSAGQFTPVSSAKRPLSWILRNMEHGLYLSRAYLANRAFGELFHSGLSVIQRHSIGNRGYGFADVSLFCVFSEYDAEGYSKNGSKAKRIVATGLPGLFDLSESYETESQKKFDYVIFTTCEGQTLMTESDQLSLYSRLISAIRSFNPNAKIGIKYHPLENKKKFHALENVEVIDTLEDAFFYGKVMVGTITTVLVQSLLRGHPVVVYQPRSYDWPPMFFTEAAKSLHLLATDEYELADMIAQSINREDVGFEINNFRNFWIERLRVSSATIKNLILELCV